MTIENEQIPFILDSGASCSIIAVQLVSSTLKINRNDTIKIRGVNGNTTARGSINVNLNYGDLSFQQKLYVVNDLPPNVPALLGTDFLLKYEATLNFKRSTIIVTVGGDRVELPVNSPLAAMICVPARSEITAFLDVDFKTEHVLLNEEIKPHVFIANTIIRPINGRIPVKILNVSNKPVILNELKPKMNKLENYDIIQLKELEENTERANKLLKELKLNHLKGEEKAIISKICLKYKDIFCLEGDKLTVTKIFTPSIAVKEKTQPVYTKPYRLPNSQKDEVAKQINKMLENNIIEEAKSEWNSPVLLVPKKSCNDDKKWRLVIDYRKVNNAIQNDRFELGNIEDIIDSLAGAKYFTHLDLSQGYYQCEIDSESRPITAFTTASGQFQMTRLPMGLKISPSTFSRLMTVAMSGLCMEKCLIYLDDIIIFGKTLNEHNKNLISIFERLRGVNLKLNPSKCNFLKQELIYLGHFISAEGIRPDPSKVECVENWPTPKTADEVKRFVAFSNYYRKHIKDFSKISIPLNKLTKKGVPFEWTEECQHAFETLKLKFLNPPILDYPNFDKENTFKLQTDASGFALGAVLSNQNGRPVAFASRALNKSEQNYGTIEKELLAVVWSIRHFRPYLFGRKFDLETDHRPLVYLFSIKDPSSRLTKFRLALEEYDFNITYIPGKDNVLADALSRITSTDLKEINKKIEKDVLVTTRSMKLKETNTDPVIGMPGQHPLTGQAIEIIFDEKQQLPEVKFCDLKKQLIIKPAKTLIQLRRIAVMLRKICDNEKINELVLKTNNYAKKFYNELYTNNLNNGMPPIRILNTNIKHITDKEEQKLVMNDFHILPTAGHSGIKKTLKNIQSRYFWTSMSKDITNFIKSCESCQRNKHIKPKQTPMIVTTTATSAFSKIYLDLVGPLLPSNDGHKYILTTQCELTKFITATPIKDKSTEVVAKAFVENVLLVYGIPDEITTDRGTEFMSDLFKKICELLQINKLNSTAYHHQTVGALENSHKTLGNFLRIYASGTPGNWSSWIRFYQFAYNTTTHLETNKTPFELVFGKICKLPSNLTDTQSPDPIYNIDDYEKLLKYKLQKTQLETQQKLIRSKIERVAKNNTNSKEINYSPGQLVLIKNELKSKLHNIYLGPFSIVSDKGTNVEIRIGNKTDTIHKSRVKAFITRAQDT